jgi:uncharacterized integral membrane protein
MRRLLLWIVLLPLALAIVLFAVANRGAVTVSLDPFSQESPAFAATLPLFVVIFAALVLGVLLGGIAVSIGKLRWRLAAHRAEREAARLKETAEAERRSREAFGELRGLSAPGDRAAAE